MAVEVRPISLPRDAGAFIDVWWTIYKDAPHWVPPLRFERKEFLDPAKNPYFGLADLQCFIAYKDGEAVGTVSAQLDCGYQEANPDVGFFGFLEFIDDREVSKALIDTALAWLRARGMKRALGPFNFNTNHECALLVGGFDSDPLVMMVWNPAYYMAHYEAAGLGKEKDLYAYWLANDGPIPEKISAVSERFLRRHPEVTIRRVDTKKFDEEVALCKQIYNDAWADNWGFVRLTDKEFDKVAAGLKPMVDGRYCYLAFVNDEPAAFSLTLPDFNQVVKPMNGSIFPFGWWHWLTRPAKIDQIRVFTLGVRQKYQNLPLGAPLYQRTWDAGREAGIKGAECSWVLEDNHKMRSAIEKMGGKIYKTYRIYGAELNESA
ncbi:MAG: N-acetyltransferase [Deltaproteobacteria bacterium]|nr:N-acetyltransferase [Deltaproteobacteria bacterium]